MTQKGFIKALEEIVGKENVFDRPADTHAYSYDAAVLPPARPLAVVRPVNAQQMARVVKLCYEQGLALTPRGAGTNLSGGTVPQEGGVVVLTTGMRRIKELNREEMYAVVEPGVITATLAAEAAKAGLFYPPDPGSQAVSTLGGNVAENAGGLRGLKYGVTRDYVMALEFVDATGGLVRSGARTVKCVTGYNLAGVMVGSEGTLGVITEITLRLVPPPRASMAMVGVFGSVERASEAVAAIIGAHVLPATLEFMDNFTIRAVEQFTGAGLPVEAEALLLVEVDGHPAQVKEEAEQVQRLMRGHGARSVDVARDRAERDRLWEARRVALSALARLRPTVVLEDATVPRSRLPEMVGAIAEIAQRYDLEIGVFGHAGDGNLHPTILCDRRDSAQWARVEKAIEEMFVRALELGGTLSGEHGIGLAKRSFLSRELPRATMEWSRRLKAALDPKGILNPGKAVG